MIGFLSTFLRGAEIGFFRSDFLETMAFARIVRRVRAPMLIARSLCFSVQAFWDSGQYLVATYLFYHSAKVSRREKGWTCATYALGSLERQKEQTHVHRSSTFLVKVGLILPRVRAH